MSEFVAGTRVRVNDTYIDVEITDETVEELGPLINGQEGTVVEHGLYVEVKMDTDYKAISDGWPEYFYFTPSELDIIK